MDVPRNLKIERRLQACRQYGQDDRSADGEQQKRDRNYCRPQ